MAKSNALRNRREDAIQGETFAPKAAQRFSPDRAASLDRLIHERMRLGIVSALAANESLSFNELKQLLRTTDGNLSVHARKLEDAGYVECSKSFDGRLPKTEFRLTALGRRTLENYLNHMEALIRAARSDASEVREP